MAVSLDSLENKYSPPAVELGQKLQLSPTIDCCWKREMLLWVCGEEWPKMQMCCGNGLLAGSF